MIRLNTVAADGLCVRTRMCIQFDFLDADGSGEIDAGELQGWGCCPSHVCFLQRFTSVVDPDPLTSLGLAFSRRDVDELIASVDQDGTGEIGE